MACVRTAADFFILATAGAVGGVPTAAVAQDVMPKSHKVVGGVPITMYSLCTEPLSTL